MVEDFVKFLKDVGLLVPGVWGALLFLCWRIASRLLGDMQKNEAARGRWVAWLRHNTFARRYKALLDAGLNHVDRLLSPNFSRSPTNHTDNRKTEPGRAWSFRLLDICLLLAVAYPVLSFLVALATNNYAAYYERLGVWGVETEWQTRTLPFGILGLIAFVGWITAQTWSNRLRPVLALVAVVLAFALALAIKDAVGFSFGVVAAIAVSLAFPAIVVFSVVNGMSNSGAGAISVSLSATVAVAGVHIYLIDFEGDTGPLGFAYSLGYATETVVLGVFATMVGVFGALAYLQHRIGLKHGRRLLALSSFCLFVAVFIAFFVASATPSAFTDEVPILVFLGFLPLLNAWADFASIGLTRWRLRWGLQNSLIFNALLDIIAALSILLILAFSIVAIAHFTRVWDRTPLLDISSLLRDLNGEERGKYWWLGFVLFSTLLPTLLHLCVGAFAFFTLISNWVGKPIASGLVLGDTPGGRVAAFALSFSAALSVWLPCIILWYALTVGGGALLDGLIAACEWFNLELNALFPVEQEI